MSQLVKQANAYLTSLSADNLSKTEVKALLIHAHALAKKAQVGYCVAGFFDGGLIGAIESFAAVATPLVAVFGDYELSNLLGALKVWLAKKKAEAAAEQARVDSMTSRNWDDMRFNYSF